jgi:hypothetical protein
MTGGAGEAAAAVGGYAVYACAGSALHDGLAYFGAKTARSPLFNSTSSYKVNSNRRGHRDVINTG